MPIDCQRCIYNIDGVCSVYRKNIYKVPDVTLCDNFKMDSLNEFDDEAIEKHNHCRIKELK